MRADGDPQRIRPLSKRREAEIRHGLAPGNFWIGFPTEYARQLLKELDKARSQREQALELAEKATGQAELFVAVLEEIHEIPDLPIRVRMICATRLGDEASA